MKIPDIFIPSEDTKGFNHPEKLPKGEKEAQHWQEANKAFWEKNSMRYDWRDPIPCAEFSAEFYREIDRRFLGAVHDTMPWKDMPFEQWINFESLPKMDVLEIGVGNGTHAQLLASKAKSYTGIDLTAYAVTSTTNRLIASGIPGQVLQMDAENMTFPESTFDFVWSWGVIHHSADTGKILKEIHRVLKPGGKTCIMVYYRSWWSYYIAGTLMGMFQGHFLKGKSLHTVNQIKTDGALARYYTRSSWTRLVEDFFDVQRLELMGNKGDLLPMPGSRIKSFFLSMFSGSVTHFMLNQCRMGSFLICEMNKK